MVKNTSGQIYIHSATAALCPHIEWAIGTALGAPVHLQWINQNAEPGTLRAETSWQGNHDTCAQLVSGLMRCTQLRFEVTRDAPASGVGERYSYTPSLGIFQATTDELGNLLINENRIQAAVAKDALGGRSIHDSINDLLGTAWDDELEVFRHAGQDAPVRWLNRAV